jgi:hypothetical protein
VALAVVLAACGSTSIFPQVISAPGTIGLGTQRVLVALVDPSTQQLATSPEIDAVVVLRDENGAPLGEYPTEFVYTVPGVRGLYAAYVDIPAEGVYQITVKSAELGETPPAGLFALEDPVVVSVGDPAPRSETRTLSEYDLSVISSDPDPEPAFYELSLAEAIGSGPTVVVFASPAWCTSEACGPLLDRMKEVASRFPGISFVHVETFEDVSVQSPDALVPVPAVAEWGLPSEPWVFVIDAQGMVSAAFEGSASEGELMGAIAAVAP